MKEYNVFLVRLISPVLRPLTAGCCFSRITLSWDNNKSVCGASAYCLVCVGLCCTWSCLEEQARQRVGLREQACTSTCSVTVYEQPPARFAPVYKLIRRTAGKCIPPLILRALNNNRLGRTCGGRWLGDGCLFYCCSYLELLELARSHSVFKHVILNCSPPERPTLIDIILTNGP